MSNDNQQPDPFMIELDSYLEANMTPIERLATSKYFTFCFEGDEVIMSREMIEACEKHRGEPFVVWRSIASDQMWPRSAVAHHFTKSQWEQARATGATQLDFNEWQVSQLNSLPLAVDEYPS